MRRDMKKIGQHVVLFLCIRSIWLCFFLKLLIDNVKNLYLTSKINFTQKNSLWQLRFQKQMKGNDLMSHLQNVALQVITLKN